MREVLNAVYPSASVGFVGFEAGKFVRLHVVLRDIDLLPKLADIVLKEGGNMLGADLGFAL